MKNLISILFLGLTVTPFSIVFSQNTYNAEVENYYIYINNFGVSGFFYDAYFSIDSSDEDFSKETYFFRINYTSLDYQSLYSLGKRVAIDLDTVNLIRPKEYFKGKTYCEIHKELSLMTPKYGKRLIIITDLSNTDKIHQEPDKKYMVWHANYFGSIMADYVWTNMGRGHILEWD